MVHSFKWTYPGEKQARRAVQGASREERRELLERIGKRIERDEGEEEVPVKLRERRSHRVRDDELQPLGPVPHVADDVLHRRPRRSWISMQCATRNCRRSSRARLYDVFLRPAARPGMLHTFSVGQGAASYAWYIERTLEFPRSTTSWWKRWRRSSPVRPDGRDPQEARPAAEQYVRAIPESFMAQLEEKARLHLFLGRLAERSPSLHSSATSTASSGRRRAEVSPVRARRRSCSRWTSWRSSW